LLFPSPLHVNGTTIPQTILQSPHKQFTVTAILLGIIYDLRPYRTQYEIRKQALLRQIDPERIPVVRAARRP